MKLFTISHSQYRKINFDSVIFKTGIPFVEPTFFNISLDFLILLFSVSHFEDSISFPS